MSTTIESLELEIQANSKGAVAGIDSLTQSLTKLKSAIKGGLGLTAVANELRSFDKVDASGAVTKMETISSAISKLSNLPKPNLSGYITPLKNLPKALEGMNNVDMSNLNSGLVELVESLEPLYDLAKTNLSGYITPLKDLPQAFEGLNSVDMSAFNSSLTALVKSIEPLKDLSASNISGYITPLKNLPKALAGLNEVDMTAFETKMEEVAASLKPLEAVGRTSVASTVNALKKLPAALEAIDTRALYNKIQSLTRIFKPLADEMAKVAQGFSAMPSKIQKLIKETDKMPSSNKKAAGSFTDLYHQLKSIGNTIGRVSKKIGSAVEKSMDYTENMNLFTVSMGEYASEAYSYAEKVSDAMGIDTSEWTRAQGVFMTLATGFGVAGDRAATMSKNLTQLSYDLSSFYNMDVEDAMLKVKSGLAGELEPLRAIGYDLSQAKLEATALELGISKSVSAMTQAEKAQLRYYAIMTQVTQTHGDMARTLEDPANQVRVFKAQINMAAREIGNMFIPALNAIIPYATAIAKVIGYIASNIAGLFGYEDKGIEETTSKVVENTDAVTENLSDAQEEAKKLKSYMLGFDELNVINPNEGSVTDTSGEFDFELPTYNFMEGLAESKVNTIVEDMKEWLGITEDVGSWSDLLATNFGNILVAVGLIATGLAAWKISGAIPKLMTKLPAIFSGISVMLKTMGAAAVIATAIAGATWLIENTDTTIEKIGAVVSAAALGVGAILAFTGANLPLGIGLMAIGAVSMGAAIAMNTNKLSDEVKEVIATITSVVSVALLAVGSILAFTGVNIPLGIALMAGGALTMGTAIIPNWNELSDNVKSAISALTGIIGVSFLALGGILAFSGAAIPLGIALMVTGAASLATAIALNWNSISDALKGPVGLVTALIGAAVLTLGGVLAFSGANIPLGIALMVVGAAGLVTPIALNWDAIREALEGPVGGITALISGALLPLGAILAFSGVALPLGIALMALGAAGLVTVVALNWNVVGDTVKTVIASIMAILSGAMLALGVLLLLSGVGIGLGLALIFGALAIGTAAWKLDDNPITRFVKGMVNAIFGLINGVITLINELFHFEFDGLVIGGVEVIPAFDFRLFEIPKIPLLAEGGFPETGQMFIAREAGAEMVGNIGRRTAVVNNDQIVASISGGVAEANEEQNILLREQNSLLRAILEKDSSVYLDGRNLTNSVEKYQRERGRNILAGGVI